MAAKRILVVDDEATTRDLLTRILTTSEFEVTDTFSAEEALALLHRERFDLVTLDVMMPFVDGFECCRRIRQFSRVPVIFVTARNESYNEVLGLECGADDYIQKPYHPETVVSRVRAVLRRTEEAGVAATESSVLTIGPLNLDLGAREAYARGKALGLTTKEFDLLLILAQNCGRIVSRETLADEVWGGEFDPESKTLRVHVYRLRKKLDEVAELGGYVTTKRQRGYLLSPGLRDVE